VSTALYCDVSDVERILGLPKGYFTETTTPSYEDVQAVISQVCDYIDRRVHFAWRERWANDGRLEYHTVGRIAPRGTWFVWLGYPIYLNYRKVRQFDKSKGDVFEFFNGNEWEDWLTTRKEGLPGGDYWVDYDSGVVYLRGLWSFLGIKEFAVRFKYRYGETTVPEDIKLACAYLTAAHLITISDRIFLLPEGGTNIINAAEKVTRFTDMAELILERWREYVVVE
jgi:hypothetical protein